MTGATVGDITDGVYVDATARRYDVVMLVLNDVSVDGRVRNEAAALAADGRRVLVIGTQRADGSLPDRERLRGFEVWRVRYGAYGAAKWWPWRWVRHAIQAVQIVATLRRVHTRVYHAHDLPALLLIPFARVLRRDPPRVVYDAHEVYLFMAPEGSRLRRSWHRLIRPLFMGIERALARRADAVLGLAEARVQLLARWYDIPRPVVIENFVDPVPDDAPAPVDLRQVVGPDRRCVVHTGFVDPKRRATRELIAALRHLPGDIALVFLGGGDGVPQLDVYAGAQGLAERVHFLPPVAPEAVAATIRAADAAAVLMRAESWNTRAGLPNKLFEAVAAGLPVVASDMVVLRRIVRRYDLGVLVDHRDPAAIAQGLLAVLSPDGQARYRVAVRAAQADLNWAREAARFQQFYRGILDG